MEEDLVPLRSTSDLLCEISVYSSKIVVKVMPGNLEEEHVKRIVARVQQVAGGSKFPVLVIPDKNTKISFFAVRVLASEDAMNYAKATAYIIRSFHHQIMAEALFATYSPSKPLKVFKEENEAVKWLSTFA